MRVPNNWDSVGYIVVFTPKIISDIVVRRNAIPAKIPCGTISCNAKYPTPTTPRDTIRKRTLPNL